ncbi:MAG: EamA family transporter, partial [Fulvivirga sp.]
QQYITSSFASIVITTPFWFVVLDKSQWHINFKNGWIMGGIAAGMVGVVLLIAQRPSANFGGIDNMEIKAILTIIAGSFLWVVGSLQLRKSQKSGSVYTKTSIHLIAAAVFAIIVSFLSGEGEIMQWSLIKKDAVIALLYLSIVSTSATFLAFIWLIKHKPVALVSTYSYVNPMVAVLLGVFIGGEVISGIQIIAMLIILLGVLSINIPNYKHKLLFK